MKKWATLSLFACLLTGCSSPMEDRVACPKTAIVAELSKTVVTQDGVVVRAEMDSLLPVCYMEDDRLRMEMRLRFTGFRPSFKINVPLTFKPSYFVAILDEDGTILSRSSHEADLTFEEGQGVAVSVQQVYTRLSSSDVCVYVVFDLDEKQLLILQKERSTRAAGQMVGRRP